MEKTRGSILICIRSRDLHSIDTSGSGGTMNLFNNIHADHNEILSIKLLSSTIPNSWYNLSSELNNNTLSFMETNDTSFTNLIIPNGSYNILELVSAIKVLIENQSSNSLTYTFTYDEITNALTITNSNPTVYNTTFEFSNVNSCRRFLGFEAVDLTITSTAGIVSNRAVDTTDTFNSIYCRLPNINSNKIIESSSSKYSNVIAHIPIIYSRNAFQTYEPNNPFEMYLNQKDINSIQILFTFQDSNKKVYYNKGDWEINLEINFYKAPETNKRIHTIHRQLLQRVLNYENNEKNDMDKINELKQIINIG